VSTLNRSTIQARYTQVMAGIAKHITTSVSLAATAYTAATLAAPFQAWISAAAALATAKASFHAAVVAEQAAYKTAQTLWLLLQAYARTTYGADTATLADFGYAPEKHTAPTPEVQVAAAAKRKATRAARHTMGSVQKKAVTGASPAPETTAAPVVPPATK
jgi:hypothetical protein